LRKTADILNFSVIVAALGYFVDIFDLILFGVVKDDSLLSLGFSGKELLGKSVLLLNLQMAGMLFGGILWGILGDKKGRLSVLFGSIFLYSAANIANGFVTDITTYAILRFIAGVGLAGELGAGITLVTETLSKEKRGYGTMIVVVFGALGAVLAAFVGQMAGSWRIAYFIGGGLGLALFALRVGTLESGMFKNISQANDIKKGDFISIFTNKSRFLKYLACICIGLPVWFTIGILIIFSKDFAAALHINGTIVAGKAIMFAYLGLSLGDLFSGMLSQVLQSRKKVVLIFLLSSFVLMMAYLLSYSASVTYFYTLCFLLGIGTGFWAIFVTIAAEQFGTNLRATVTTTVPNFVRGAVVPLTSSFLLLQGSVGIIYSAMIIGTVSILLSLLAVLSLKESFSKDLNYLEELA
jgi:MFS family permease